jgi:diguanylate cyclase (GGDEF)-like protein/PAS domain S-box-containing protein
MDPGAESPHPREAARRASAEELPEWAPDAVVVADGDGRIVFANAEAERLFGYARAELVASPVERLMPERFRQAHVHHRERYATKPATRPMSMGTGVPLAGRRKDGSEFPVEISLSTVGAGAGGLVMRFIRGISDRQRMEQHLQDSREMSKVVLNSLDSHIVVLDAAGVILAVNDAWQRFVEEASLGAVLDGGVGEDGAGLWRHVLSVPEDAASRVGAGLKRVIAGGHPHFVTEYRTSSAAGDAWFLVKVTALSGKRGGAVVHHTDVTGRKQSEQLLLEQARRDALTGVLNHGAVTNALREMLVERADGSSLAVAVLDVDGMREVNDTHGFDVGDDVLIAVARAASAQGAMVGRYGGGQFVAVLPGADRAEALVFRRAVRDHLAKTPVVATASGSNVPVAVSIGFALYPEEAQSADQLLRLADAAMYSARRQARAQGSRAVRSFALERADAAMREITPLLTSPEQVDEKLRRVAHRVAVCAGYDVVAIDLFDDSFGPQPAALFAQLPHDTSSVLADEYVEIARGDFRAVLERAKHQVSLVEPSKDQRLTPGQRASMERAGLRAVVLVPILEEDRVVGALTAASREPAAFGMRDGLFLGTVATQVVAIVRMSVLVGELRAAAEQAHEAHRETVMMLAAAAEAHDHTTGLHLQNIRILTEALAREMGYADEAATELGLAATLHDIGKIRVPKEILLSPEKLSATEWAVVKQHTTWGAEFLFNRSEFRLAARVAQHHHERWDGQGYPAGLRGAAIPEEAAIVAVADAFDAMTHDRPYRDALTQADAIGRIVTASGTQFSPNVVRALVQLQERRPVEIKYRVRQRNAA